MENRIKELDRLIVTDANLGSTLFHELRAAQRELGLLQGNRSTCPFLLVTSELLEQYFAAPSLTWRH